ncbi:MAG: hypothetical protein GEU94_02425 [Micromonosporaceae bacterium]|nr:hypothetical protein [Micromonosporaceae bacterium]
MAFLLLFSPSLGAHQTAHRVAWAAAAWGLPQLLGHAREALAARRITLPLVLAAALVAIGAVGLPFVTAVVVAAVLVTDLLRRPADSPGESQLAHDSPAAGDEPQRVKG